MLSKMRDQPEYECSKTDLKRKWIAGGIAGTTVLGMVALTVPFVVLPTARKGLPYMATPAHKLKKALEVIRQRRLLKRHKNVDDSSLQQPRRVFVDLGSGDGEGVYQAVKFFDDENSQPDKDDSPPSYYYSSCIGIELNMTLYLLSNFRRLLFWSRPERARSQFQCRDFWTNTTSLLRTADTVLIFGVAPLMQPLSVMLRANGLRRGTHVVSYRFPLPVVATAKKGDDDDENNVNKDNSLLRATLIYDEEEMRIYECI